MSVSFPSCSNVLFAVQERADLAKKLVTSRQVETDLSEQVHIPNIYHIMRQLITEIRFRLRTFVWISRKLERESTISRLNLISDLSTEDPVYLCNLCVVLLFIQCLLNVLPEGVIRLVIKNMFLNYVTDKVFSISQMVLAHYKCSCIQVDGMILYISPFESGTEYTKEILQSSFVNNQPSLFSLLMHCDPHLTMLSLYLLSRLS